MGDRRLTRFVPSSCFLTIRYRLQKSAPSKRLIALAQTTCPRPVHGRVFRLRVDVGNRVRKMISERGMIKPSRYLGSSNVRTTKMMKARIKTPAIPIAKLALQNALRQSLETVRILIPTDATAKMVMVLSSLSGLGAANSKTNTNPTASN